MNTSYANCSLYLCPVDHSFSTRSMPSLILALQQIGFIAERIETQEIDQHYLTGNKFLDHIAYMGCAPAIQFEASEDNSPFCFIKIHDYKSTKLIYSQQQSRNPHCPKCKKTLKKWHSNLTGSQIHCDQCDTTSSIEDLNWRKMAGYARLFIEITDIFPKEAMPQQSLLQKLAEITDTDWAFFYSCQNDEASNSGVK